MKIRILLLMLMSTVLFANNQGQKENDKIEYYKKYIKEKWSFVLREIELLEGSSNAELNGGRAELSKNAVKDLYNKLLSELRNEKNIKFFKNNQQNWEKNLDDRLIRYHEKLVKETGVGSGGASMDSLFIHENSKKRMCELLKIWIKLEKE